MHSGRRRVKGEERLREEWGAGVGQGAADETSLVGGMVVRNGVTGIVVQHSHSVCRVRYDSGVSEVLAVDDMLDWLI